MRLNAPPGAPPWLRGFIRDLLNGLRAESDHPVRLQSFTVAELPVAAEWTAGLVHVSDEAGGPVPAFSDGTDWRRVTDRALIS